MRVITRFVAVLIDTPDVLAQWKAGFGAGQSRGNLLLHEPGHVVGLDHVSNPSQQMNTSGARRAPKGYAAGDRAGLAKRPQSRLHHRVLEATSSDAGWAGRYPPRINSKTR